MRGALAQSQWVSMPHIFEFPAIFIGNKACICLSLFLFPSSVFTKKTLINFTGKNKTLHLYVSR